MRSNYVPLSYLYQDSGAVKPVVRQFEAEEINHPTWIAPLRIFPESLREDLRFVMGRLNHAAPAEHAIYERLARLNQDLASAVPEPAFPKDPYVPTVGPDHDPVNHPRHYTQYEGLEIIDLTEQMNFNLGNAVKYLARAGFKDPAKEIEDLKKAQWYVTREIERREKALKKTQDENREAFKKEAENSHGVTFVGDLDKGFLVPHENTICGNCKNGEFPIEVMLRRDTANRTLNCAHCGRVKEKY